MGMLEVNNFVVVCFFLLFGLFGCYFFCGLGGGLFFLLFAQGPRPRPNRKKKKEKNKKKKTDTAQTRGKKKKKTPPPLPSMFLFCCLGGWLCSFFCCLGGWLCFFWVGVVCFFFFAVWAGVFFFFLLFGRGGVFFFCCLGRGVFIFLLFGRGRVLFLLFGPGACFFFAVWAGDGSSLTYPSAWLVFKRPNNKRDRTAKKNTGSEAAELYAAQNSKPHKYTYTLAWTLTVGEITKPPKRPSFYMSQCLDSDSISLKSPSIYIYICIYTYVYIYIYREREIPDTIPCITPFTEFRLWLSGRLVLNAPRVWARAISHNVAVI